MSDKKRGGTGASPGGDKSKQKKAAERREAKGSKVATATRSRFLREDSSWVYVTALPS